MRKKNNTCEILIDSFSLNCFTKSSFKKIGDLRLHFFMFFLLQSDIVHQSVYELVHSEDREELQRQLLWNSFLPPELSGMPLSEALAPDKIHYLERSFTVRFRCLLDNTSGFLVRL
jgi:hypothetical protein